MVNETIDLVGLLKKAEDKPVVVSEQEACGLGGVHPALMVLREPSGRMGVVDLLDAAKARAAWAEELNAHPFARRGTATLTALASFVAWVGRFKKPETVIFATPTTLTAVIDYHGPEGPEGLPGHQRHRGVYQFPFSREWKFWSKVHEKALTQAQLAELVEEHIGDMVTPTGEESESTLLGVSLAGPSTMLHLARGIEVRSKLTVKDAITLASGECRISFDETHETSSKDGSALTVPGGFMVSVPIYENGARWKLAVRLRYRPTAGGVMWLLALHHADAALQESYEEVIELVGKETSVPVLRGWPEKV